MADNSSHDNFVFNKALKESGYPKTGPSPVDFWYDKMHYGRVNQNQDPVMTVANDLSNAGLKEVPVLKQLSGGAEPFAVNFVADAFNEMRAHFQKATAWNRLDVSGMKEIRNLEPKKAHLPPLQSYSNYINLVFNVFHGVFLADSSRRRKIISFGDYVRVFRDFHDEFGHELVVTRSGFMKSRVSSPLCSGLIIELDVLDPSDSTNATKWISDPNFNFYKNAAAKYGFMVDKNMPWRLVADVSSKEMQSYWVKINNPTADQIRRHKGTPEAPILPGDVNYKSDAEIVQTYTTILSKYGLKPSHGNSSNLFDVYYEQTYKVDAGSLKELFYNMYQNNFIVQFPRIMKVETPECRLKKLSRSYTERTPIGRDELDRKYTASYWMELCFRMRLKEENLTISEKEYNKFVKNTKKLMNSLDNAKGMEYTNNVIKMLKSKTIDPRFCQNYQGCQNIGPQPIHVMGQEAYTRSIIRNVILGMVTPNIEWAEMAIKSYFEQLEEMASTAKAVAEAATDGLGHETLAKMHGF